METWKELLDNQVLVSSVIGWTVAQVLKTLIDFAMNRSFHVERLTGSGGNAQFPFCYSMCVDDFCRHLLWSGIIRVCSVICHGDGGHV